MGTKHDVQGLGRAVAVAALVALSACGGSAASVTSSTDRGADFDGLVAAVEPARVAWCPLADGEAYVPLPAPPTESAAAAPFFRYLEGRIYQFSPCDVAPNQRNELRVFRYADADTRDAAIRAVSVRHLRPTASFAIGATLDAEIWSPDPSLEGPVGRAAAAMHGALGQVNGARHLELAP